MVSILGIMLLTAVFGSAAWTIGIADSINKPISKDKSKLYITIVLIIGLAIRIIAAVSYRGHTTDMACFISWSDTIFNDGISQFYLSGGFHDYPPGYVYVMYVLGAVKNLFSLNDGPVLWLLMKSPAIIADMVTAYIAYNIASKKQNVGVSAALAALVALNPTVILNSSVWGQVDSILSLFCVLSIYMASEKKLIKSFFMFAIAILIKPQAIFFAPVLIFAVIEQIFMADTFKKEEFNKVVLGALGAILMVFVLFMPFGATPWQGIKVVVDQYFKTMGQYNHMTINAFNLYGAFGLNWDALTTAGTIIGYLFIIAAIAYSAFLFFRSKSQSKYFIVSFILVFSIYMLSVKMHERYAFPGIFMLLFAIVTAPTAKNFFVYLLFSLSQYFNTAWVLFIYEQNPGAYFKSGVIIAASLINLILLGAFVYLFRKEDTEKPNNKTSKKTKQTQPVKKKTVEKTEFKNFVSEKAQKITAFDLCAIIVISVIYGCVAYHNLGNKFAPQTEISLNDSNVVVDLGRDKEIADVAFFLGARHLYDEKDIEFTYINDKNETVNAMTLTSGSVFSWNMSENVNTKARYVVVSTNSVVSPSDPSDRIYLRELCLLDEAGNTITPVNNEDENIRNLFDEQDFFVDGKSYMAGTYFDEIYHPRTAYEFIHGMSVYEWTHPPLGKVLMSIGILIFGMVPFGWRFIGTLFGVFMVGVMYMFARRMFKNRWLAVVTCLLFTFDFMHFTQTRLATIDTYVTFFIMLMYYYMYKYYNQSFYDTPLYKTFIPLGISGIFFGLSVASKWTGLYAGAGLAIIFFITIYERFKEYRYALNSPGDDKNKVIIDTFKSNTIKTLAFCVLMFVVVPFAIYAMSYIPYLNTPSGQGFSTIFKNAKDMLTYHGKTVVNSTHPYSSQWYEWPIMYKPLWYFSNTLDNGLKQGISAFGNPAVWWLGIGAVAYNLALAIVIPLRNKNYFGKNKYFYGVAFGLVFALLCVISAIAESSNPKLERLFPCMLLYSAVIVGAFFLVLAFDKWFKKVSPRTALFLTIGFFSGILPWTLVVRTTYIYHYFTCVPFVVLMIGYSIKTFYDNAKNKKLVIICTLVYTAITIGLFILFYPVISGAPVSYYFAEKWLKWFNSWVLVG